MGLAVAADEAQPEEEAPEGVLFAFHLGLGGGDPRGLLGHLAEGCDQAHVSLCLFRLRHAVPPRKLDPVLGPADHQAGGVGGLLDQGSLAVHQLLQAVEAVRVEATR